MRVESYCNLTLTTWRMASTYSKLRLAQIHWEDQKLGSPNCHKMQLATLLPTQQRSLRGAWRLSLDSFRMRFFFPGTKHAMSNLCQNIMDAMPAFREFYVQLKAVETLASTECLRKRFQATCLASTSDTGGLDGFPNITIIRWRWMSVALFLEQIIHVLDLLHRRWDGRKFQFKLAATNPEEEWESERLKTCHQADVKALNSCLGAGYPMFSGFAKVIAVLTEIVNWAFSWMGGCPCHDDWSMSVESYRKYSSLRYPSADSFGPKQLHLRPTRSFIGD